jgi:predicted DNA-binding antitoxin AbrB/MazE fold protein
MDKTWYTISYAEVVCRRIEEQSLQARKPSAEGMLGPVRAWLGGLASPATFVLFGARGCLSGHGPARVEWVDRFYSFTQETAIMAITIEATYENGVLKPAEPLPLKEHEQVRLTVESAKDSAASSPDEAERIVRRSYGLLGWTGDVETLRRVAEDPEFALLESP